jgi:hypothetical protein
VVAGTFGSGAFTFPSTLAVTGVLTVSGFGTHTFSAGGTGVNRLQVANTTSGTANFADVFATANLCNAVLRAYSTGYTTSGVDIASSVLLSSDGSNGLSIVASNASGAIRFYSGGSTERMRIHTSGQLFHGGTSSINGSFANIHYSAASYYGMEIADTGNAYYTTYLSFISNGVVSGSVTRAGGTAAVAYNTTSDQRMKRDLGLVFDVSVLRETRIHDFAWKDTGEVARGVFAQEAIKAAPFAVTVGSDETKDGHLVKPWSVDYSKYVPDLIVGWQQHDATIQLLAARIAALEAAQESK